MGYLGDTQAFFDMSKDWYATRMNEDWDPLSPEEAARLWARHGFTGGFWDPRP